MSSSATPSEWAEIVGEDNVTRDPAVLGAYARDESFVAGVEPGCVVRPTTPEQVVRVVDLARRTLTPLVPVSSGPPHFRGDTVPLADGALMVDLTGMRRIIRVDRPNRVAMFEPGVTFVELAAAVSREGLRLNMPFLPRSSKSVVGSLLEREPVTMPKYHWDIGDPLACVEVVFGTGDVFRTGSAAGPGSVTEQWDAGGAQKEAAGPSAASWYRLIQGAQGTMGIVTWASARCEVAPQMEVPFVVGAARLERLIEVMHWLVRRRLVNECFVLNRCALASVVSGADSSDWSRGERVDPGAGLPEWVLFFNVAGYDYFPRLRIEGQITDILNIAREAGLEPQDGLGEIGAARVLSILRDPSPEAPWKIRREGAVHDISSLSTNDRLASLIKSMNELALLHDFPVADIGVYLQPIVQGTACHCEFSLFYDPEVAGTVASVKALAREAAEALATKGAFFSRPYDSAVSVAFRQDPATVAALRKVKAMVDPLNLMNPGKLCFGDM